MPTVTDPNNPLGLTVAAPGYLPADQRAPKQDPDLGWSPGMVAGYSGQPDTRTPEQINADQQPLIDWGNMDQSYWTPREQSATPLILGALGAIAAPFALSALGIGAGAAGAGAGAGAGSAGALSGSALANAVGAGATSGLASGAGAGALGSVGAGLGSTLGAAGLGAAGLGAAGLAAGAGNTVSDLIVTAASTGLSAAQIGAIVGVPAATVASIVANAGGANSLTGSAGTDTPTSTPDNSGYDPNGKTVDPVTVTPDVATGGGGVPLAVATVPTSLGVTMPSTANPTSLTTPPSTTAVSTQDPGVKGLINALTVSGPAGAADWIKANPLQAAQLGILAAGLVGGSGTPSGGGSYTIPTGNGAPGTLGSLNPIFTSGSIPTGTPRTQNPLPNIDWKRYAIQGPEQSFFSNVPQSPAPQFSVNTPAQNLAIGAPDLAALKKKFGAHGFAKGGRLDFAVHGAGDGRSDSIPAKLSDGEYVMDAETVSMLGNGSTKAGAQKLDQLRVNLRKHKGKQLARGRFSVTAKDPAAYMTGGSV